MSIDIRFFNSFVLKKTINNSTSGRSAYIPIFPGLINDPSGYPLFPTSSNNATGRTNNTLSQANVRNWIIEESRIRGGFNEVEVGYGVRAYLREESNDQNIRTNAMIFSGIYNSETNINRTNVFSVGEQITRAADPYYGSIQKLHTLDSNIAILQENKVSRGLVDKDEIYSAEGGGAITSTNNFLGQITPYVGDYGISTNPESFAYYGYRRYFVDKNRGSVMRLSKDGLTEISQYGMSDFFRDELSNLDSNFKEFTFNLNYVNDSSTTTPNFKIGVTGTAEQIALLEKGSIISIPQSSGTVTANIVAIRGTGTSRNIYLSNSPIAPSNDSQVTITKFIKDAIVSGWDTYNKNYVVSLQNKSETPESPDTFKTLSFEDDINGWTSFHDYEPNFIGSLKNKYYSFYKSEIYQHYHPNSTRTNYYGNSFNASIEFIFNANPSIIKNFKTVNYEGSNGWQIDSLISDPEGFDTRTNLAIQYNDSSKQVKSYDEGLYTENGIPYRAGFNRKENKYFANLINNSEARPGEVFFGSATTGIKGYLATVKVSTDATTDPGGAKELFAVSTEFVVSSR